MSDTFADLFSARLARDTALNLLEESGAEYLVRARAAARALWLRDRNPVTVDDVRLVCPPPAHMDPRVMGAIFRSKQWRAVNFVNGTRKASHSRPVRSFEPA